MKFSIVSRPYLKNWYSSSAKWILKHSYLCFSAPMKVNNSTCLSEMRYTRLLLVPTPNCPSSNLSWFNWFFSKAIPTKVSPMSCSPRCIYKFQPTLRGHRLIVWGYPCFLIDPVTWNWHTHPERFMEKSSNANLAIQTASIYLKLSKFCQKEWLGCHVVKRYLRFCRPPLLFEHCLVLSTQSPISLYHVYYQERRSVPDCFETFSSFQKPHGTEKYKREEKCVESVSRKRSFAVILVQFYKNVFSWTETNQFPLYIWSQHKASKFFWGQSCLVDCVFVGFFS